MGQNFPALGFVITFLLVVGILVTPDRIVAVLVVIRGMIYFPVNYGVL